MDYSQVMARPRTILSQELVVSAAGVLSSASDHSRSSGDRNEITPATSPTNSRHPSPDPGASESEGDWAPQLIKKPIGEAGRPGRGGYNLKLKLKWEARKYKKVKVSLPSPFILCVVLTVNV